MASDTYKTIKSSSTGLFKDRGSRFVSFAFCVTDIDQIKPIIDKIRKDHHEARHHCFAFMIGADRLIWRTNDDGEPSGTAGKPILGQINSHSLTNILIVVSRYFGGTLLGVPGLINAYKSAALSVLENCDIIELTLHEIHEINFPYENLNVVMKILKEEAIDQSDQEFDLECRIRISIRVSSSERIITRLSRITGLTHLYIETR